MSKNIRKVAVVTGAAGAIGREICLRLDKLGLQLVLVDRNEAVLEEFATTLSQKPFTIVTDLGSPGAEAGIAAMVSQAYGRCDVLVNNAGIVVTEPFETAAPELFEREIRVNLIAPMLLTRALFPMLQIGKGHVLTIVSLGSLLPLAECPGYSASKFGLRGLMLALALRTPKTGVKFSTVNPAAIDTPMLRHEALHGGSVLNFLDPPHPPALIGDAVLRLLDRPRVECDAPAGDGLKIRIVMAFPNLFHKVLPWFESQGRKGRLRYLKERGLSEAS